MEIKISVSTGKKKRNEKPYRAGQSLAGPPNFSAQTFSSFLKKLSHPGTHFVCKPKLFHSGLTVVIRRQPAARLVRVGTEEIEDGTTELSGISLQVIKKVDPKEVRMNVALPALHDHARVRAQQH